jgi:hypothetical protein
MFSYQGVMFVICIREYSLPLPSSKIENGAGVCEEKLTGGNDRTSNCSGASYSAQDGDNDLGNAFFGPTTFDNLVSSWLCVDA